MTQKANREDLTGRVFERLVVIERCNPPGDFRSKTGWWLCECACGTRKPVRHGHLTGRRVRSCGCLRQENVAIYPATHRASGTPTWHSWRGMKDRCSREKHPEWKHYGGKGIKVCSRWLGENGFQNFLEDMGERPEGKTLDRIDSSGNYCPENCRWATNKEQRLNVDTKTNWIEFRGETLCLTDWAERLEVHRNTIYRRLRKGWSIEKTFTEPFQRW